MGSGHTQPVFFYQGKYGYDVTVIGVTFDLLWGGYSNGWPAPLSAPNQHKVLVEGVLRSSGLLVIGMCS